MPRHLGSMMIINMLVFRILATVFMGFSCITTFIKNITVYANKGKYDDACIIATSIYGWLWRAFVIVALWLI